MDLQRKEVAPCRFPHPSRHEGKSFLHRDGKHRFKPALIANINRRGTALRVGAKVAMKSSPGICENPRATSRALCRSRTPCESNFLVKTHLFEMIFRFSGGVTSSPSFIL